MQVTNAKIKLFAEDTNVFMHGESLRELENTALIIRAAGRLIF